MTVDVLNQVKNLLRFESSDDFYYLQILQRKKENPHMSSNTRVIKSYYINSVQYLEAHYDEVKALCNAFNARAMLRLNKRSYKKVAFKALQNMANTMANGEYGFLKNAYDRACGDGHNDKNKTWIVDVDGVVTTEWLDELKSFINSLQPEGDKIVEQLPTKNGLHLITKPFNLKKFKDKYPKIDVHKDNPVNLYIP